MKSPDFCLRLRGMQSATPPRTTQFHVIIHPAIILTLCASTYFICYGADHAEAFLSFLSNPRGDGKACLCCHPHPRPCCTTRASHHPRPRSATIGSRKLSSLGLPDFPPTSLHCIYPISDGLYNLFVYQQLEIGFLGSGSSTRNARGREPSVNKTD